MKNILFKLKRWFLENFIYSPFLDESKELTKSISEKSGIKNLRAELYAADMTSKTPYKLVVFINRKRAFEQCYETMRLEMIANSAALHIYVFNLNENYL